LLLLINDIKNFWLYQVYDCLEGVNFRSSATMGLKYGYFFLLKA